MTSRISFRRLLREELRHHVATFVIYIACLFASLMSRVMNIQSMIMVALTTHAEHAETVSSLARTCRPTIYTGVLVTLIGVFAAIEGYSYLHSKRKMDFFGALPVKRERKFSVVFVAELLMFAVVLAAHCILSVGIVAVCGYGSTAAVLNTIYANICFFAVFMIGFSVATLAMVMTGNLFIAVCGTCALFFYMPFVRFFLFEGYAETFFSTYVEAPKSNIEYCLSPSTVIYKLYNMFNVNWSIKEKYPWILVALLFSVVVLLLAGVLHKKRPTESAGTAMAFRRFNGILEVLIIVPVALCIGIFFFLFASYLEILWMLVGIIAGLVGGHVVMSCAFSFDLKESVKNLKYFFLSAAICVGVIVCCIFDVTGYDERLPKQRDLKAVFINDGSGFWGYNDEDAKDTSAMSDETLKTALQFADESMREHLVTEELTVKDKSISVKTFSFTYVLKNGRLMKRNYSVREDFDVSTLKKVYNQKDYKESILRLQDRYLEGATEGVVYSSFDDVVNLTAEEVLELYHIYMKDYMQTDAKAMVSGEYFYYFTVINGNGDFERMEDFFIYPDFKETYQYLEKLGIKTVLKEDIKLTKIKVGCETWKNETTYEYTTYELTDAKKIEEYADKVYVGYGNNDFETIDDSNVTYHITVSFCNQRTGEMYEDLAATASNSVMKEITEVGVKIGTITE